jgi:hypothetical protein
LSRQPLTSSTTASRPESLASDLEGGGVASTAKQSAHGVLVLERSRAGAASERPLCGAILALDLAQRRRTSFDTSRDVNAVEDIGQP